VLHSVLASQVSILGVCPNLVLLVTVSCALLMGTRMGVIAALAGGLALDALSGAPFGISTVALVIVALLAGLGETNVFRSVRALPYVAAAGGTLFYCVIELGLMGIRAYALDWGSMMWHVAAPLVLVNTLSMLVVYNLAALICRRTGTRRVEWMG